MAVEANQVETPSRFARQRAQQLGDRLGVVQRDVALDAGQLDERHVVLRGFEHAGPQLAVVGQGEAAEELDGVLAVGGDQGDVGAVGRGAAHQTQELFEVTFSPRALHL